MLRKFHNNEKGFTLIELMIVIAIIGILAAIAIPQFGAYRMRAYNAAANTDLKNAITAQEAYYIDEASYTSTSGNLTGNSYGLQMSDSVTLTITSADSTTYVMSAVNSKGDKTYTISGPGGTIGH